jgi:hypothetical protein
MCILPVYVFMLTAMVDDPCLWVKQKFCYPVLNNCALVLVSYSVVLFNNVFKGMYHKV